MYSFASTISDPSPPRPSTSSLATNCGCLFQLPGNGHQGVCRTAVPVPDRVPVPYCTYSAGPLDCTRPGSCPQELNRRWTMGYELHKVSSCISTNKYDLLLITRCGSLWYFAQLQPPGTTREGTRSFLQYTRFTGLLSPLLFSSSRLNTIVIHQ